MSTPNTRLSLLACPLTEDLAGEVWLYHFPDKIKNAWIDLRDRYRYATGSKGNLPYEGLLMVLRASAHTSASLYPSSKDHPPRFLALSRSLSPARLRAAIVLWEQALLTTHREHAPQISIDYPSDLADLITSVEPQHVSLWDHMTFGTRTVDAPSWVWESASCNLARHLAGTPLKIDGYEIELRPDTENNLLVWRTDQLWSSSWFDARPDKDEDLDPSELEEWKTNRRFATLRIKVAMKSLPGLPRPLVLLHPSASRFSDTLKSARTAWLAPKNPSAPLLSLYLGGKGEYTHLEHTSRLALDAWVRLLSETAFPRQDGETDFLPRSAMDLSGTPGNLRALIPYSVRYPIGRGAGLHTVAALADHTSNRLGQPLLKAWKIPSPAAHSARKTDYGRDTTLLDTPDLPNILSAAGCTRLRILALYVHQEQRTRMQRLLAFHFNRPELADGVPEDTLINLSEHVEVLLHHAPELLTHGTHHRQRRELTAQLPALSAPDTGVLALCETTYDASEWSRQRRAANLPESQTTDPYELDAKPHVTRYLAQHHVLAQHLNANFTPRRSKKKPREATNPQEVLGAQLASDHPGHHAIGDMLRAAGLVHPRLTRSISHGSGLKDRCAHVGLHLRVQRGDKWQERTEPPKLMWTLVAFLPEGDFWAPWAYIPPAHNQRFGWFPYATAQTIHRGAPLPDGSRQDDTLPRQVDKALYLLGQQDYVLYISGRSTRSLWPLLANKNHDLATDDNGYIKGRPALPGLTLPEHARPRAIVRTTAAGPDLPLPAYFDEVDADGAATEGDKTSNALYRLEDTDRTFILCNRPHQMDGKTFYAKAGRTKSRWSPQNGEEQAETWYSLNATEITILHHPEHEDPGTYAMTAARLCNHALAWEHRTQHPLPIHAAIQMDKDHPDYRRSIDWEEDEENS